MGRTLVADRESAGSACGKRRRGRPLNEIVDIAMSKSWWDLGEGYGRRGEELQTYELTCPFCEEAGNFSLAHRAQKKKPNERKILNFDTYKCGSCAGFVMVLWSASSSGGLYDFRVLPWPRKLTKYPEHWPETVGRFWLQAHRSLNEENWDAAAVMARSALQAALRHQKASGPNLKAEIEDLAKKGLLPPIIRDWAHNLRDLANESAHPTPNQAAAAPKDARDIVQFLDFLLEYLYDLPERIKNYREPPKVKE